MSAKLHTFYTRCKKLGIDLKMSCNYPWIYIDHINGKRVTEKFHSSSQFTLAFYQIDPNLDIRFTDISEIFKILQKYR